MAACSQMTYSLGVGIGTLIMFSSYNDFHNNVYSDAMLVSSLDFLTSFIIGITIFSILGSLQNELGLDDITTVVKGGKWQLKYIQTFRAHP